jgi:hypothetical protein
MPEPHAPNAATDHPAYTTLRNHAMGCERCATGAECRTGAALLRAWDDARKRLDATAEQ